MKPSKPSSTPVRDNLLTTKNKITVRWGASSTTSLPILGYELHMNAGNGSPDYALIYRGSNLIYETGNIPSGAVI